MYARGAWEHFVAIDTRSRPPPPLPPIDKPPPRVNCSAWSRWVDTAIYNQLESYTPVRVSTKHAGIRGRRVHRRMLFRLSGAGVRIADSGSAAICIHLYIPLYSP